ncbi:MAG: UDP-N-acetylmuramoyl-L-alanine--D-glutamate ligase [Vicinamibacterales bacterium]
MSEFDVTGKHVVVVGAARSGVAAAELLVSRGARVTLTDARSATDEAAALQGLGVTLELGGHVSASWRSADLIVLSPGVPLTQPDVVAAKAAGTEVIGELELASRWLRGRIVAVTGTKGKSTTTTLIGRMLDEAGIPSLVAGNIGVPLSRHVPRTSGDVIHVVEVSSFQLETATTFHPWVAVLLNLTPDHLDRHPSFDAYVAAKARLFAHQTEDDWVVLNADDPRVVDAGAASRARPRVFGLAARVDEGITVDADAIVVREAARAEVVMPLSDVRLIGTHSLADVLAAVTVGSIVGVPHAAMAKAVRGFEGLEHALERVATVDGVLFVNDSKATNIAAARQAIVSFGAGLVVVLGGRHKAGDFADLRTPLAERGARVVAIGESRDLVHSALDGVVAVDDAASMDEAVRRGYAAAAPGDTVLLSPACASFDMFRDYAERGQAFKAAVRRLARDIGTGRTQ